MARRRNYNRRKRGRFSFLYKLLSVLVVCCVLVVALTLFFRVDTITVSGQERYTQAEIIETTGVSMGDNLSLLNKSAVAERLYRELPYIYEMRINKVLPDTLDIQVTETYAALAVIQDGSAWLISPKGGKGKILEQRAASAVGDLGRIEGCELLAPTVAEPIAMAMERKTQHDSLLSLMAALDAAGMMDQVKAIHLDDLSVLTMDYTDRFRVELPYGADYAYKLRALQTILDSGKIESNEVGTIRMTQDDGHVTFIKG